MLHYPLFTKLPYSILSFHDTLIVPITGSIGAVKVKVKSLSRVPFFATPWTIAYPASLSIGFSRQEYQSGLTFPSPGDLPDPGIKPGSLALQAEALPIVAVEVIYYPDLLISPPPPSTQLSFA